MGQYGVLFWEQLLGYFPKGTQLFPLKHGDPGMWFIFRLTLPKTNSSPLKINGWKMIHFLVGIFPFSGGSVLAFFFGWPIFSLQTKDMGMFIETNVILLMEEIRLTTQHVWNPVNNEMFTISTGEFTGFLNHQQYSKYWHWQLHPGTFTNADPAKVPFQKEHRNIRLPFQGSKVEGGNWEPYTLLGNLGEPLCKIRDPPPIQNPIIK